MPTPPCKEINPYYQYIISTIILSIANHHNLNGNGNLDANNSHKLNLNNNHGLNENHYYLKIFSKILKKTLAKLTGREYNTSHG